MSYTNLDISDRNEDMYRKFALLEAERDYYQKHARELQNKLENIPQAVKEYGYVDIIDGNMSMKLVQETLKTKAVIK